MLASRLPSGAGGPSRARPDQLESASSWCSVAGPRSGNRGGDLKRDINKPFRDSRHPVQSHELHVLNIMASVPLLSSFLICSVFEGPEEVWRGWGVGSGEGNSRRMEE